MSLKQTDKFWHSSFGGPLMWQFLINKTFCIFVILTDGMFRKIVVSSFRIFFYLENEEFEHVLYFSSFFFSFDKYSHFLQKINQNDNLIIYGFEEEKKSEIMMRIFNFLLLYVLKAIMGPGDV